MSVITALNVHKDEINHLGSIRFAKETGQSLTHFFSEDSVSVRADTKRRQAYKRSEVKVTSISDAIQELLWNQPHSANTKIIPGKLSICLGMPVIIRHNAATELCITKGQEGVIHGWQSSIGSRNQRVLDVLFVKLLNPPQTIKLDGLEENVVPLTPSSVGTVCFLPDDSSIRLSRKQVEVLPNFSMTDFSSQGKTRPYYVVDLNNSRIHQSYYTALSRSSSAAGTVILQGFDARKIMSGASGALCQEFRELELLDDIGRLRYIGKLPSSVFGDRRNTLIGSFREWKGKHYVPQGVHKAIRWGKADPFMESTSGDFSWHILEKPSTASKAIVDKKLSDPIKDTELVSPPFTSTSIMGNLKRKLDSQEFAPTCQQKKKKMAHIIHNTPDITFDIPMGTQWRNNSCAYDAVVSSLFSIWKDDPILHLKSFKDLNDQYLGSMADGFTRHVTGEFTLNDVRDFIRRKLQRSAPNNFSWGEETSVHCVLDHLLNSQKPIISSRLDCPNNHSVDRVQRVLHNCFVSAPADLAGSIQEKIDTFSSTMGSKCQFCESLLVRTFTFIHNPFLLAFDVSANVDIIDKSLVLPVNGNNYMYSLRSIMYYGDNHFTSHIITPAGLIWFHDGIETGTSMEYEGNISSVENLSVCRSEPATAAIYVATRA